MATKEKFLLISALILISLGMLFIFQSQSFGKLRLIFCDVGQGDGILIIAPSGKQIVVDGGPGTKIVDCLGQKIPFWDRKIELVVLTHPQRDHLEGLVEVLARYQVEMIMTTGVANETDVYRAWEEALKEENTRIYTPNAGDEILVKGSTLARVEPLVLKVLWPSRSDIDQWGVKAPKDLNETSIVMRLEYGGFCAYLTGDIPKEILETLIDTECELLKVSHHGSKTGTNEEILDSVNPEVAVIQVGKNSFGHPTKEVLDLLESKGVKILRNDINGIIEVVSDAESFSLWSQH
ncbi:hypothetical protein HYU92_00345 [Candidatus Curtissbacteria bacterium]|nr:hypothetical protein [Candidatus Curtissbacteria bacterium]